MFNEKSKKKTHASAEIRKLRANEVTILGDRSTIMASDMKDDLTSAYSINSPKEADELAADRRPTSQFLSKEIKAENRISGGHYMAD